ncbi:hypothetical protein [Pseudomonas sp. 37 R 15]|nr:hypothetical protein [Pseudomonas sp. 37 R 15]
MVDAADVLDHAVCAVTRQVAGAVQACARRAKRVRYKTLGGERRPRVITTRQADPADQQLAGRALRAGGKPGIEDEQRGIGDGPSDKRLRLVQAMGRRPDGGFRRPVEVPHRALQIEQALGQVSRQRFAAAQALDTAQQVRTRAVEQHAPGRRRGLQHAGRLAVGEVEDGFRVGGHGLLAQQHRRADTQRHIKLQGEDVE